MHSEFSLPDSVAWEKMSLILELIWAHLCILIKRENISLIFGEETIQGLDVTTLAADVKYLINFTQLRKRFVLSLHYNGNKNFSFVNATKMCQFKVKDSETKDYNFWLGNLLKDFTINNMKKRD